MRRREVGVDGGAIAGGVLVDAAVAVFVDPIALGAVGVEVVCGRGYGAEDTVTLAGAGPLAGSFTSPFAGRAGLACWEVFVDGTTTAA